MLGSAMPAQAAPETLGIERVKQRGNVEVDLLWSGGGLPSCIFHNPLFRAFFLAAEGVQGRAQKYVTV
jgi:hypothetical protein